MNLDRNSIIGFVLLIGLAIGFVFYSQHEAKKFKQIKTEAAVSEQAAQKQSNVAASKVIKDTTSTVDSTIPAAFRGEEKIFKVSNNLLTLDISNKGAYPVEASLRKYKSYNNYVNKKQEELKLFSADKNNKLVYKLPIDGHEIWTDELYFTPQERASDSLPLVMTAAIGNGKSVIVTYALSRDNYMMDVTMKLVGMESELSKLSNIPVQWSTTVNHTEKDIEGERRYAQTHFRYTDKEHDYFTFSLKPEKKLEEKPIEWIGVKAHYFNSTLVTKDKNFINVAYESSEPKEDTSFVVKNLAKLAIPVASASNDFNFNFKWFIGPNDFNTLKSFNLDMEEMIQFGFGIMSFVKYIVKWAILPLFNMLHGVVPSIGIVIILMTLIIRILLSFLTYKSQLSSAKMRVLKPEIDALKLKLGDNQQAMGMEQMKLYRSTGVNPLGGCLPMLLQMPFLLAMYYLFPAIIDLRQQKFLWAEDLSTYDNILDLGFKIPFYGDHVSLFTVLMALSSIGLALYSRQMTAGQEMSGPNGQIMKWMPFIMPLMFLGWFNNFASGLTFYYFLSNMLSLAQQYIIQKFFINEDKIHAQLKENKAKGPTTSKWQQKLEDMQKAQQDKMSRSQRR
ncbi:MAG TPA: membrane protein insertase YidC [Edaphocola sp.]|nr:membrane protein insertase YidC [Edaphocola sp.]